MTESGVVKDVAAHWLRYSSRGHQASAGMSVQLAYTRDGRCFRNQNTPVSGFNGRNDWRAVESNSPASSFGRDTKALRRGQKARETAGSPPARHFPALLHNPPPS